MINYFKNLNQYPSIKHQIGLFEFFISFKQVLNKNYIIK